MICIYVIDNMNQWLTGLKAILQMIPLRQANLIPNWIIYH